MNTCFIHMQILVHLLVNKTNFHMKDSTCTRFETEAKGNWEMAICCTLLETNTSQE